MNSENQVTNPQQHQYTLARNAAVDIEKELDQAQSEYQKEVRRIIQQVQAKFLRKYGSRIQELEDLQEAIEAYKAKGLKQLKRNLQQLYITEMEDTHANEENIQQKAKELYNTYRDAYCPPDEYQKRRDMEARKLQRLILDHRMGYDSDQMEYL